MAGAGVPRSSLGSPLQPMLYPVRLFSAVLVKHRRVMDEGGCLRGAGARPAPRMRLYNPALALQAGPGCDCLGLS